MRTDWNEDCDFHVLFLPRSGSHMLVDALNSHPEIDCSHSDQGHHGSGDLKGHARCCLFGDERKVILLTRNAKDRTESFFTDIADVCGSNHTKKPLEVHRRYPGKVENRFKSMEIKNQAFFDKIIDLGQVLHLRYEDLTEGGEMDLIPEKYRDLICDFLDIERLDMNTSFRKPVVV